MGLISPTPALIPSRCLNTSNTLTIDRGLILRTPTTSPDRPPPMVLPTSHSTLLLASLPTLELQEVLWEPRQRITRRVSLE